MQNNYRVSVGESINANTKRKEDDFIFDLEYVLFLVDRLNTIGAKDVLRSCNLPVSGRKNILLGRIKNYFTYLFNLTCLNSLLEYNFQVEALISNQPRVNYNSQDDNNIFSAQQWFTTTFLLYKQGLLSKQPIQGTISRERTRPSVPYRPFGFAELFQPDFDANGNLIPASMNHVNTRNLNSQRNLVPHANMNTNIITNINTYANKNKTITTTTTNSNTNTNNYRPQITNLSSFATGPFATLVEQVAPATICNKVPDFRNTCSITINLSQKNLDLLRTDPTKKIYLFSAALKNDRTPLKMTPLMFPYHIELRVNDKIIPNTNTRGIKGVAGTAKPVDLSSHLTLRTNSKNTVSVMYAQTTQKFIMAAYLINQISPSQVLVRINTGPRISKDKVQNQIISRNDDDDVVATSSTISLKCPLSFCRIQTPIRSISCQHVQCFDALSYIQLQEQALTWKCPICNNPAPLESIVIDDFFKEILDNTSTKEEAVELLPSGEWTHLDTAFDESNSKKRPYTGNDDDSDDGSDGESSAYSNKKRNTPHVKEEEQINPFAVNNADVVCLDDDDDDNDIRNATSCNDSENNTSNSGNNTSNTDSDLDDYSSNDHDDEETDEEQNYRQQGNQNIRSSSATNTFSNSNDNTSSLVTSNPSSVQPSNLTGENTIEDMLNLVSDYEVSDWIMRNESQQNPTNHPSNNSNKSSNNTLNKSFSQPRNTDSSRNDSLPPRQSFSPAKTNNHHSSHSSRNSSRQHQNSSKSSTNQKRTVDVIDLTLSDDDEPPRSHSSSTRPAPFASSSNIIRPCSNLPNRSQSFNKQHKTPASFASAGQIRTSQKMRRLKTTDGQLITPASTISSSSLPSSASSLSTSSSSFSSAPVSFNIPSFSASTSSSLPFISRSASQGISPSQTSTRVSTPTIVRAQTQVPELVSTNSSSSSRSLSATSNPVSTSQPISSILITPNSMINETIPTNPRPIPFATIEGINQNQNLSSTTFALPDSNNETNQQSISYSEKQTQNPPLNIFSSSNPIILTPNNNKNSEKGLWSSLENHPSPSLTRSPRMNFRQPIINSSLSRNNENNILNNSSISFNNPNNSVINRLDTSENEITNEYGNYNKNNDNYNDDNNERNDYNIESGKNNDNNNYNNDNDSNSDSNNYNVESGRNNDSNSDNNNYNIDNASNNENNYNIDNGNDINSNNYNIDNGNDINSNNYNIDNGNDINNNNYNIDNGNDINSNNYNIDNGNDINNNNYNIDNGNDINSNNYNIDNGNDINSNNYNVNNGNDINSNNYNIDNGNDINSNNYNVNNGNDINSNNYNISNDNDYDNYNSNNNYDNIFSNEENNSEDNNSGDSYNDADRSNNYNISHINTNANTTDSNYDDGVTSERNENTNNNGSYSSYNDNIDNSSRNNDNDINDNNDKNDNMSNNNIDSINNTVNNNDSNVDKGDDNASNDENDGIINKIINNNDTIINTNNNNFDANNYNLENDDTNNINNNDYNISNTANISRNNYRNIMNNNTNNNGNGVNMNTANNDINNANSSSYPSFFTQNSNLPFLNSSEIPASLPNIPFHRQFPSSPVIPPLPVYNYQDVQNQQNQ